MTIFEKTELVKKYYESIRQDNVVNGFVKRITTDGTTCVIVYEYYQPSSHTESVFYCDTRKGTTYISCIY